MIPSTRSAIAQAVGGADSLPVMPAAIVRVLQALETEAGIGEHASLVSRDVALATRVMRIANSTLSNVLHGKRQLTRDHIRRLAKHFKVDPGIFHG